MGINAEIDRRRRNSARREDYNFYRSASGINYLVQGGYYSERDTEIANTQGSDTHNRTIIVFNRNLRIGDRVRVDSIPCTVVAVGLMTTLRTEEDFLITPLLEELHQSDSEGIQVDFSGEGNPKKYIGCPPGYWKMKDDSFVRISEMGDNHIQNTIKLIEKRHGDRASRLRVYMELVTEINNRKIKPKIKSKRRIRE